MPRKQGCSFCHHQLIMDHGNPRSVNLLLQAMTAVSLLPKYMFRHVDKQHWCGYKKYCILPAEVFTAQCLFCWLEVLRRKKTDVFFIKKKRDPLCGVSGLSLVGDSETLQLVVEKHTVWRQSSGRINPQCVSRP